MLDEQDRPSTSVEARPVPELTELLLRIVDRERAALAELHDCLGPQLRSVIGRELSDATAGSHVLRATFVEVWLTAAHHPPDADLGGWVAAIARRRCAERLDAAAGAAPQRLSTSVRLAIDEQLSNEFHYLVAGPPVARRSGAWSLRRRHVRVRRLVVRRRLLFDARFEADEIGDLRTKVRTLASSAGLSDDQVADLVVAVNEIMSNVVRHGGGFGELRVWRGRALDCEIRDLGHGFDPLQYAERTEPPAPTGAGGLGLWIAGQLCDTLSISSSAAGTTVRISVAPARQ
jgi:anti-sigma regulatory factor (Ser/Thr protein kinase)/DNA-directed RNA polymerase specialized sigma24 family protein